jgi:competence protein ComFC
MKCLLCESLSLTHICKNCQSIYLKPQIYKRKLFNGIEVISFYRYDDIKDLIFTKHTDLGYYIFSILAQNSFKKFASEFNFTHQLTSIAIDDNVKNGYSHTAILNNSLKSPYIKPLHSKLRSNNDITYSGKTKEFRLKNPRDFQIKKFKQKEIILVDDIITTGSTLTQAIDVLKKEQKEVLFCLTLCDAALK